MNEHEAHLTAQHYRGYKIEISKYADAEQPNIDSKHVTFKDTNATVFAEYKNISSVGVALKEMMDWIDARAEQQEEETR